MRTPEDLASLMAASGPSEYVQLNQTRFRLRLVQDWGITEGARVLEIGCGQGDTTAVLADAVGENGRVVAVDIADPSYGAPVTLGESAKRLKEGPLGDRIDFRFKFDPLDPANGFEDDAFDVVVLAHCTWYFASLDQLRDTLVRIRPWAGHLCLSEWDLTPLSMDQFGHLMAVLIQGQVEAYKEESQANVRSPYSRATLRTLLEETGWDVASENLIDASELEDARWEIDAALANSLREAGRPEVPARLRGLIQSQVDVLRQIADQASNRPLPSYSIVANRRTAESSR